MRFLTGLILLIAALWSGYWYVGSSAKEHVLATWLDQRKASGWTAEYTELDVVGFPNRFDSQFQGLKLGDPRSGIVWSAPFFNILALSYKPNHIIAVWPDSQTLAFLGNDIDISSSQMQASVIFQPDTNLAVLHTALRTGDLELRSSEGWQTRMDDMAFSTRQSPSRALAHDVAFSANGVEPTQKLKAFLDPKGTLPKNIETLRLDAEIGFSRLWDRIAIETGVPEVTSIDLNNARATWGDLDVFAAGELAIKPNGTAEGTIDLNIKNWRAVLNLMATSQALDAGLVASLEKGLALLTALTETPRDLSAPLNFSDGQWFLGPIPMGFAPRFIR